MRRDDKHRSLFFDDFPLVVRPPDCPGCANPGLGVLAWGAAEALAERFPPRWLGSFTPRVARLGLATWCLELADMIRDSSRLRDVDEVLATCRPDLVPRMQHWLDGHWSDDRDSLEHLCWHIELSRPTISAAMWLHRFGDFYKP